MKSILGLSQKFFTFSFAVILLFSAAAGAVGNRSDLSQQLASAIQSYFSYGDESHKIIPLIDSGADINTPTSRGVTALIHGANVGDENLVRELLKRKPNLELKDSSLEDTALMMAVKRSHENIVKLLLDAGADSNARDYDGSTPLIEAVFRDRLQIVRSLIAAGADPDAVDEQGDTALGIAKQKEFKKISEFLANLESPLPRARQHVEVAGDPSQIWARALEEFAQLILSEKNISKQTLSEAGSKLRQIYRQTVRKQERHLSKLYGLDFDIHGENTEIAILVELVFRYPKILDLSHLLKVRAGILKQGQGINAGVVGGGPLGLIAAIRGYSAGANVLVSEKRKQYVRDQIMGINVEFAGWLTYQLAGFQFGRVLEALGILELRPEWTHIRPNVQPRERFFSVRIQQLEHVLALIADQIQRRDPSGLQVMRGATFQKIEDFRDVDLIIGADGSSGKSKELFNIQSFSESNVHWAGTALFVNHRLLDTSGAGVGNYHLSVDRGQLLKRLQELGWSRDKLPATRFFVNGDIIYLGAEVPQELGRHFSQQPEASRIWFRTLVEVHLPPEVLADLKWVEHVPSTTVFPVELFRSTRVATQVQTEKGRTVRFLAVGDTAGTPHFLTRSGINVGFGHTKELEDLIMARVRGGESAWNNALQHYERNVQASITALFERPTNSAFLSDGPFLNLLDAEAKAIRDELVSRGQPRVSYQDIQDCGVLLTREEP